MRDRKGGEWALRARLALVAFAASAWGLAEEVSAQQSSGKRPKQPSSSPAKPSKPVATNTKNVAVAQPKKPVPTFTKDVAPILQARCQNCHRRHQVGPFALETYVQARKRARDIASVTEERSMPPWKPTSGVGPKLKHDQSMTHAEIATLNAWAEGGAPEGDPKHLPPPRKFVVDWKLGPPDVVLEPGEGFPIPATGPDIYRFFVLPTNLTQDAYLEAVDYAAGEPASVHHLIAYIDPSGQGRELDRSDSGPGFGARPDGGFVAPELSFWTAGSEAHRLPEGIGIHLPRQSDVILQIHYHPSGKPGIDKTRVGLYFARKPVKQALHWNNATSYNFQLPPGAENVEVKASWFVPIDVEVLAVSPHMHLLGRDMHMSVRLPSGRTESLIEIADWDPSWQSAYQFQKPIPLAAGSVVHVVAHFDNSAHSRNPNHPPKLVKVGPNFDDEMCVGYIAVVKKGQDLTMPGTRDDLFDIFIKQRERMMRKQTVKKSR